MRFTITKSDHGKHSDAKLAYATARDLVEDAANMSGQDALDMRKLENTIGEILEGHFKDIADREHEGIKANGHEHLASSLDAHENSVAAMEKAIFDAYDASPFAAKMDKAQAAKNVREVVSKWIKNAQHMHRDWFAGMGKVGHGKNLEDHKGWDRSNEHVVRWFSLHQAKTPDEYRKALHEISTGERLPAL